MTATDQQLRAIAFVAAACRPTGSRKWDEAGVYANLTKVRTRSLGSITIAAIQAAEDRNAETPGVIPQAGPHWRTPEAAPATRQEIDAAEHCASCGGPRHDPIPEDHEYVSVAESRGHKRPAGAANQIVIDLKTRIRPLGDRPTDQEHTDA